MLEYLDIYSLYNCARQTLNGLSYSIRENEHCGYVAKSSNDLCACVLAIAYFITAGAIINTKYRLVLINIDGNFDG